MFGTIFSLINNFKRVVNRNTLFQLLIFVIISTMISVLLLHHIEVPFHNNFKSWFDCFWAATLAVTAGYSDGYAPDTNLGMMILVYLTLLGMGAVGTFIAWIASIFVEYRLKEGMGLGKVNLKNHIIICNWSFKGEEMVKQLRADDIVNKKDIVILSNIEKNPFYGEEGIYFVHGDPSREDDLKRAGIMECSTAIVLADIDESTRNSNIPDSKSILIVLAIESLRNEVYTVAEVLDPKNIPHFRRADVDEIVSSSEFSGKLLVQATINHGITELFVNMLTFSEGSEIYKFNYPKNTPEKSYEAVHNKMFKSSINIVAIEKDGKILLNPPLDAKINDECSLYGICDDEPVEQEIRDILTWER